MRTLSTILFLTLAFEASAFTLLSANPPVYKNSNEIIIDVTSDGCSSAGISAERLLELVMKGAEEYWNSVETANIEFKEGSVTAISGAGKDQGALLSDAQSLGDHHVLVGCTSNVPANAAAIGGSGQTSSGVTNGAVAIKDVAVYFRDDDIPSAILAHELGHVLGLGHSRLGLALMDSSGGAIGLNKLTQDDRDGATYLYGYEASPGGCFKSLGTIDDISKGGGGSKNFWLSLMLGLLLIVLGKKGTTLASRF